MTIPDQLLKPSDDSKGRSAGADAEQLKRYGARYTQYRSQYDAAGRFEYEPPFPLYLMLEQTYLCNLRCPMCIQGLPSAREAFVPGAPRMPWDQK